MTEPPGARLRVALSGLTVAEYFRDQGLDVLLFIDNIFRFTQAGSESLPSWDRCHWQVVFNPTFASERGEIRERIIFTKTGQAISFKPLYFRSEAYTTPA